MKYWIRAGVIFAVTAMGGAGCIALGEEYCALRVTVHFPNGEPAEAPVDVLDSSGQLVFQARSVNGEARICDLGFDVYSLQVGGAKTCQQVVVKNVIDRWPQSQQIFVTKNICGGDAIMSPRACRFFLRVRSSDGAPLSGVESIELGQSSDSFGRIFGFIPGGTELPVSMSMVGYADWRGRLSCALPFPDLNVDVVLRRR